MVSHRARKGTSRGEGPKMGQSKNQAQSSAVQKSATSKSKKDRKKQRNRKLTQPSATQKKPLSKSKRNQKQALQQASKPITLNPKALHAKPSDDVYNGVPSAAVGEVFSLALEFRRMKPTVDVIVKVTKTELDREIVSSLIEAALRLLPPATTPQGIKEQQEISRRKGELSRRAENEFIDALRKRRLLFLTEKEQQKGQGRGDREEETKEKKKKKKKKQQMSAPTPDIRFKSPVDISGHTCLWLEYKNFFGFRKNPFVAKKNRKQLGRYATEIGPGAVVYRLGYEMGHLDIEGVRVFRQSDLLAQLR
ncbi:hypothetical protein PVAR5_1360 [Paecilomyces variotii No. 5]|uniref:Uncharacterized protein n=1 Tax=Byssochlamys spectabilis (strain No. 5 / NBRC 109023) TaxID=1356009 RepID=V5F9F3_BYSSN|nr:hypothetical protein PVAR5_1360 [Paecilomyces variotii No. 5]